MPQEEMQRHTRSRLVRYAEAVLRRVGSGRPFSLRLPHFRHELEQIRAPKPTSASRESEEIL
jgi:hypothetical protein